MDTGSRMQSSFLISTPNLFEVIHVAQINNSYDAHWQRAIYNLVFPLILRDPVFPQLFTFPIFQLYHKQLFYAMSISLLFLFTTIKCHFFLQM